MQSLGTRGFGFFLLVVAVVLVAAPACLRRPAFSAADLLLSRPLESTYLRYEVGGPKKIQKKRCENRLWTMKNAVIRTIAMPTVRRVASNGIGVERTFLLRSPRIDKVVVERHSQVRRAQLYFMRQRTGKSARLKQKFD